MILRRYRDHDNGNPAPNVLDINVLTAAFYGMILLPVEPSINPIGDEMQTYLQRQLVEKKMIPAGIDARHVEAFIRLNHSTLNHLSWGEIRREVRTALGCITEGGAEMAERTAKSFGL